MQSAAAPWVKSGLWTLRRRSCPIGARAITGRAEDSLPKFAACWNPIGLSALCGDRRVSCGEPLRRPDALLQTPARAHGMLAPGPLRAVGSPAAGYLQTRRGLHALSLVQWDPGAGRRARNSVTDRLSITLDLPPSSTARP